MNTNIKIVIISIVFWIALWISIADIFLRYSWFSENLKWISSDISDIKIKIQQAEITSN